MSKKLLFIFALVVLCLALTEAKVKKVKKAQSPNLLQTKSKDKSKYTVVNCNVNFVADDGSTCENVELTNQQKTWQNEFLWQCNDRVAEVRATGDCTGCSVVLYEDSSFQGRRLGYNINNKRTTYLKYHYFADNQGNFPTTWARMTSGYKLSC